MAHDEVLANRLREALQDVDAVTPMRTFGSLAVLVGGHMAGAPSGQGGLLARVDPADAEELTEQPGVDRTVLGGRAIQGWVRAVPGVVAADARLAERAQGDVAYAGSLPPKSSRPARAPRRRPKSG